MRNYIKAIICFVVLSSCKSNIKKPNSPLKEDNPASKVTLLQADGKKEIKKLEEECKAEIKKNSTKITMVENKEISEIKYLDTVLISEIVGKKVSVVVARLNLSSDWAWTKYELRKQGESNPIRTGYIGSGISRYFIDLESGHYELIATSCNVKGCASKTQKTLSLDYQRKNDSPELSKIMNQCNMIEKEIDYIVDGFYVKSKNLSEYLKRSEQDLKYQNQCIHKEDLAATLENVYRRGRPALSSILSNELTYQRLISSVGELQDDVEKLKDVATQSENDKDSDKKETKEDEDEDREVNKRKKRWEYASKILYGLGNSIAIWGGLLPVIQIFRQYSDVKLSFDKQEQYIDDLIAKFQKHGLTKEASLKMIDDMDEIGKATDYADRVKKKINAKNRGFGEKEKVLTKEKKAKLEERFKNNSDAFNDVAGKHEGVKGSVLMGGITFGIGITLMAVGAYFDPDAKLASDPAMDQMQEILNILGEELPAAQNKLNKCNNELASILL